MEEKFVVSNDQFGDYFIHIEDDSHTVVEERVMSASKINRVVQWMEDGVWHELPFNTPREQHEAELYVWRCVPGGWAEILVDGQHAGLLTTEG